MMNLMFLCNEENNFVVGTNYCRLSISLWKFNTNAGLMLFFDLLLRRLTQLAAFKKKSKVGD